MLATYLAADPVRGRRAYHKAHADRLARKLDAAGLQDRAARMRACSELLLYHPDGGFMGADQLCGQRLCPVCQARRATSWSHRVREVLPVLAELPGQWVMLTLTMRSIPFAELRTGIRRLHRAVDRLAKRREWAARGWIRNTETTFNVTAGTAHPHVHLLLQLPADYYQTPARWIRRGRGRPQIQPGYMTVARMRSLWARALGADYDPWLDFSPIKWQDPKERAGAIAEICKYGQKPAELAGLAPADLARVIGELAGHRTFSVCGELRRYIRARDRAPLDRERLISRGETQQQGPVQPPRQLGAVARWDPGARRFDLVRDPGVDLVGRSRWYLRAWPELQPLAPLAPPEWIGDVFSEPENLQLDDREERARLAARQAARPNLYRRGDYG